MELDLPAPAFTLQNQHGESISLSDFAGKQHVVIVFYPFAFSGVCTRELCELRDFSADFTDTGAVVLAVSCDPMYSLRAFADREGLDFSLLSDFWPHGEVSTSYGVFNERRGCSGRATFIVDRGGALRWKVENELPRARDVDDYPKVLGSLD